MKRDSDLMLPKTAAVICFIISLCASSGCAGRYTIAQASYKNTYAENGQQTLHEDAQPILLDTWTGRTWTSDSTVHLGTWREH